MIEVVVTSFSFGFFAGWYFFRDAKCCLHRESEE
jgi:hypothetical protein